MKIYVLEYDLRDFSNNKIHRIDKYNEGDIGDFIDACKRKSDSLYVENIKVYSGELKEIDINTVISPF